MVPKGPAGARQALSLLSKGKRLGMLIDQKMNDGIAVPFFGRDAMTAPALARFAQRYECPAVPVRLERLGGARFRVSFLPPLDITGSDTEVMARANRIIEAWIRERPEQWLWIHRRWP
jgi:KDO2-lipid IV(A) lauroyltransferase